MRRRPVMWFAISLLCFAGALYCWRLANEWEARKRASHGKTEKRRNGDYRRCAGAPARRFIPDFGLDSAAGVVEPAAAGGGARDELAGVSVEEHQQIGGAVVAR